MRATVSLQGLMILEPALLDEFKIPTSISRETLIENLLVETMDLTMMYTNPIFLKPVIRSWSEMRLPIWEKLVETTQYEYNPIDNYDRTETRTLLEHHSGHGSEDRNDNYELSGEGTKKHSGSGSVDTSSHNEGEKTGSGSSESSTDTNSTVTTDKAAYNSDTYQPVDRVTTEESVNTTGSTSSKESTNDTGSSNTSTTENASDETTNSEKGNSAGTTTKADQYDNEHNETIKAHGNIGVTTTQQMIQQEREIVNFSVMRVIIDEFIERFCLLVY